MKEEENIVKEALYKNNKIIKRLSTFMDVHMWFDRR